MHVLFEKLTRWLALLGGSVLTILVVLTCLSIVGRSMNSFLHSDFTQSVAPTLASAILSMGVGPISGDFELVEAGMAFSIFAFLPLCQLSGGHASVDIFTNAMSPKVNRILRMIIEVVFALILILIAWQLFSGMLSKLNSGQTTFLLQFPVWWSYAFSLLGAVAAALVSVYLAAIRIIEVSRGRFILPSDLEADH